MLTNTLTAGGSGFRGFGLSEASGGSTNSSATDYPLVQVRSIDSGQQMWLRPAAFSETAYTSQPVLDFPEGPALLTFFVNGIPSVSKVTVVQRADKTTTVSSGTNPSTFGQSVTFTATVSSGAGNPTGTVTFKDGSTTLGTGTLSGGTATFSTSALSAGSHTITAEYGGDTNFNTSTSSSLTQTVNKASTTTTVSLDANPLIFGQSVTITATISASAPGSGTPTGTVTFKDGPTTLGTGTLSGGTAAFSTSALSAGNHTIIVDYGGDTNFNASTSVVLTVEKASTTTTVSSGTNPSAFGQSVTFTATVTSSTGTPTGTVTFKDGTTTLGTFTLSGGSATFSTSSLSVGSHTITAEYGGDANFATSTSSGLTQTVNKANTTTTVSSGTNPSVYGQSATSSAS